MTNLTPIYWEASGGSLHTHAWAIETWGGSRNKTADKRGENIVLPFTPGRKRTKKYRDQRVLALPMWMRPRNADGSLDGVLTQEQKMQANWESLMSLVDTEDEFPLTKRWYDSAGNIKVATAMGELVEGPEPLVGDNFLVRFTLSIALADPWFYSTVASQTIGTITVGGNKPTNHVVLTIASGVTVTTPDGNWLKYNGTGTAVVDCHERTAIRQSDSVYVNGKITRNTKFPEWLTLQPGSQALTGTGTVAYDAAWK